jgi:hypothetical protein
MAFGAAKMIDVGNDALAGSAGDWCDQRHATRRHIDKLAGEFTPVHQHVAPGEVDAHALLVAAFLAARKLGNRSANAMPATRKPPPPGAGVPKPGALTAR